MTGPILSVVGARPNYMKIAPVMRAFAACAQLPKAMLLHTGQHYDEAMNDQLFRGLRLPVPDVNLNVGSGSHAIQTAEVMRRFEPVIDELKPSCVLVVGDVNSTLACALVASKRHVPVIHVEAGLRSYDRHMPEEINRVLTDQISDLLFTTERSAHANLAREGIAAERIHFVGNVMIDTLLANLPHAIPAADTLSRHHARSNFGTTAGGYAVVTLHRPSNVDQPSVLRGLLETLEEVSKSVPLICPLHPRTQANIEKFGLAHFLSRASIAILPPQGYLEMLGLMSKARVVLTDSGGIQEETTALGVPCLTLRENTERPITADEGTNTIVGTEPARILAAFGDVMKTGGKRGRIPEYWDGHAAQRIAQHMAAWLELAPDLAAA
ncbi:MAG: non-hydrolyzing UDP-N-acetylglucosamine 2-epimerase [Burkholderiales bacterium]